MSLIVIIEAPLRVHDASRDQRLGEHRALDDVDEGASAHFSG